MHLYLINEKLETLTKFLNYLRGQLDLKYLLKVQGNLIFWVLMLIIFGVSRHGYSLTLLFISLAIIFSFPFGFLVYWTAFYFLNRRKEIVFHDNYLWDHQKSRVDYTNISLIERGGDTNMSLTTFNFHDYKFVGYNHETYKMIIDMILTSGADPEIKDKKGFR